MKKISFVVFIFFLFVNLNANTSGQDLDSGVFRVCNNPKSNNNTQIIKSGEWIYDAMDTLNSEVCQTFFTQNQPMSIGELKFYFNKIDYEKLSASGKKLYLKVWDFLYPNSADDFFPSSDLRLFLNLLVSPEIYYKSNKNIPFSFDYCLENRFIEIPVLFGFSDFVTLQSDFFLGKNYVAVQNPYNFTNIPYKSNHFEFYLPRFSYTSTGISFLNWGFNFHLGKEGLQFGNTNLGSIVYNKTFETDFYSDLTFYTQRLKYSLKVSQVDSGTFLYLHSLDLRPFKNFRLSAIEGSLLNSAFQLRYLNPFMIMHQFSSWTDDYPQMTENEKKYYGEGYFCAYLAFTAEFIPFKNFRIYALYAQNEILDLGGSRQDASLSVPDSLGGQLGAEYNFSLPNESYLKTNIEAVYTSPYLYVKQSPAWSLFRSRNSPNTDGLVNSWLGSPFGPDCFAVLLSSQYNPLSNWKISLSYLFKIHGENNASSLFSSYDKEKNIYNYYPSVEYELANENQDEQKCIEAKNKGRYMWMTGTREYTHQIAISGNYSPFEHLSFYAKIVYNLIFNNKNIKDNIQQGFEFSLGGQYSLF